MYTIRFVLLFFKVKTAESENKKAVLFLSEQKTEPFVTAKDLSGIRKLYKTVSKKFCNLSVIVLQKIF